MRAIDKEVISKSDLIDDMICECRDGARYRYERDVNSHYRLFPLTSGRYRCLLYTYNDDLTYQGHASRHRDIVRIFAPDGETLLWERKE